MSDDGETYVLELCVTNADIGAAILKGILENTPLPDVTPELILDSLHDVNPELWRRILQAAECVGVMLAEKLAGEVATLRRHR